SESLTARQYDRWLQGRSLSGKAYEFFASVPGSMFVNTPVFRLDRLLRLRADQRLLDVGCGRASLLQVLASRVRFEKPPVGIDLSPEMLRRARRDSARAMSPDISLVQGSALSLPFRSELFDVVTSSYLIKHLDDAGLVRLLREMHRVLKAGGLALLWEFGPTRSESLNRWHRWLLTRGVESCNLRSFADIAAAATSSGFEWVENAHLRPFLFPPIPRVSVILGKAPEEWRQRTGPGRARHASRGMMDSQPIDTAGSP
ncbi:MAG TPA: class I SAM-dependent methyltransferase, partial [Dehalococcoidia bacterium]|nr:class I SAM-dependent methyltransferase [Dehalococcoidia bacterium]